MTYTVDNPPKNPRSNSQSLTNFSKDKGSQKAATCFLQITRELDEKLKQLTPPNKKTSEFSEILANSVFWIEDKEEHQRQYDLCTFRGKKGFCCFTHIVGLPYKPGFGHLPWFDYQLEFNRAKHNSKYLREIKATGLGFSELELYFIGWIAFQRRLKTSQIPILTGPRIDIAMALIDRLYNILTARHPEIRELIQKTNTKIIIGNTTIEAFPSHHIDAVRALPNPIYILLDEADFFPYDPVDPNNPVKVVERYIPKSNPWIILISTPNLPNGLYDQMDRDSNLRYKTFRHNYEWGLDKIYDRAQIENAKLSSSFEREFNLKYGAGIGNIFNESWIGLALLKGERLRHIPVTFGTKKAMGLDPAWGSSKFGITKIEYLQYTQDTQYSNTKRVYFSKGYNREQYDEMLELCYKFIKEDNIDYTFIDGSQVEFIRSLKAKIGEAVDYETQIERATKFNTALSDYMTVIPVLNQKEGPQLIDDAKYWMGQSKTIAIDEIQAPELIAQMRFAKQKETGQLDKTPTSVKLGGTLDCLESFLYSLKYFKHI
jgi:hypothetical protein